jgi:hypothetical protein
MSYIDRDGWLMTRSFPTKILYRVLMSPVSAACPCFQIGYQDPELQETGIEYRIWQGRLLESRLKRDNSIDLVDGKWIELAEVRS